MPYNSEHGRVYLSLGSYFRHSRSRRYTNFEGVPRNFAVADADSHLLASDRLGGLAAADLRPELVGDVRAAPLSAMDVCRVCDRFAANDPVLHAGRIGFSRFVR